MKIFIPEANADDTVFISGDDCRHLFAHRPQNGDSVSCSDGKNFCYDGEIAKIQKDGIFIKIKSKTPIEKRKISVTLFQAFLKGDKNEFVIQKATELGIDRIVFFSSDNCISKIEEKKVSQKTGRFEKIAKQAAMQCGRDDLPEIGEFMTFVNAVSATKTSNGVFFYENSDGQLFSDYLKKNELNSEFAFIVGPEGGFTDKEAEFAGKKIPSLSLGNRILRAETVPIAVSALIAARIGEI